MAKIKLVTAEQKKSDKAKVLSMLTHPKARDGIEEKILAEKYNISAADMTTIVTELKAAGTIEVV